MKTIIQFILIFISYSTLAFSNENIRIYRLDCGQINFPELSYFSDTGEYDGKSGKMSVQCFLIKHPKGWLMWDTGLTEEFLNKPSTNIIGATETVSLSLEEQLKGIGISFADINYVGFSHMHADHSGNADLFKNSTWIMQKKEFDFATKIPTPIGMNPAKYKSINEVKKNLLEGDSDVFGDGSVQVLSTPGHTPGHQSLMVKLKKEGFLIFAGDLYHFNASRWYKRVPIFNSSRAETLASIDRLERLAKTKKARIVIPHETKSDIIFPQLPGYLE